MIRKGKLIAGQNNNREEKRTKCWLWPFVARLFILSVCVSAGAAGCQVTSGQRSRGDFE